MRSRRYNSWEPVPGAAAYDHVALTIVTVISVDSATHDDHQFERQEHEVLVIDCLGRCAEEIITVDDDDDKPPSDWRLVW